MSDGAARYRWRTEAEARQAFSEFVRAPVSKKYIVPPREHNELTRRATVLVAECFQEGLTQEEIAERVGRAFCRLVNNHVKHGESIEFDPNWLE